MAKVKKTRAEIQRQYRLRKLAADSEAVREQERQRWQKRRLLKKVKSVDDMTQREQRCTRRKWREQKRQYRSNIQHNSTLRSAGMSETLELCSAGTSESLSESFEQRKKRGRAKVAYRCTKSYRKIAELTKALQIAKSSRDVQKTINSAQKASANSSCTSAKQFTVHNIFFVANIRRRG